VEGEGYVVLLTSILPSPGPRVGKFDFITRRNGTK